MTNKLLLLTFLLFVSCNNYKVPVPEHINSSVYQLEVMNATGEPLKDFTAHNGDQKIILSVKDFGQRFYKYSNLKKGYTRSFNNIELKWTDVHNKVIRKTIRVKKELLKESALVLIIEDEENKVVQMSTRYTPQELKQR
jgi:hypothetical protein